AHEGRRAHLADFDAAGRAAFLDVPFYRDMPEDTRARMERVISLENAMLAAFRPKRYDGPVLLLKASEPEAPPHPRSDYPQAFIEMLQAAQAQPDNYWAGTATQLAVRPV